uniref:hypothetical protein n=1 Tax=Cephaloticoccus sp. TaxID=1985742 RepID=UPI00404909FB
MLARNWAAMTGTEGRFASLALVTGDIQAVVFGPVAPFMPKEAQRGVPVVLTLGVWASLGP